MSNNSQLTKVLYYCMLTGLLVLFSTAQVKVNREAASLNFVVRDSTPKASAQTWSATFKPETELEQEISALLEAGGAHNARAVQVSDGASFLRGLCLALLVLVDLCFTLRRIITNKAN